MCDGIRETYMYDGNNNPTILIYDTYKNGCQTGPFIEKNRAGYTLRSGFRINGKLHGNYIEYYSKDVKRLECVYNKNVLHGVKKSYHPNGLLCSYNIFCNGVQTL